MRAVWSYWSRPRDLSSRRPWLAERYHLLSWALSFLTARRHYPDTVLVTDTAGARLLVDALGLEFGRVSTELDALAAADPTLWSLGKLYAYRAQTEPFVHIDADVYLWNRLPERLESAPVFTQSPEPVGEWSPWYRPGVMEETLLGAPGGWVPAEWSWYLRSGLPPRADCCGVVGGQDVGFIRYYASHAVEMVEHPGNRPLWATGDFRDRDMLSVEQYLLSACVEHHARTPGSPFAGVRMEHLFASMDDAFDRPLAIRLGYTHLIAAAKKEPAIVARLEQRVARDYPEAYERCLRCVRDHGVEGEMERAA
ncbi:MAG TPA: DUF6734 family protein [Longimicrobium sp.]|nr:DUF6734 family protein [Longimicrobium sp.]